MPLVDYEAEVFAGSGAWQSFTDLEDALTLAELMALYVAVREKENRFIETMGQMMGGGVGGASTGKTNAAGRPIGADDSSMDIKPGKAGVVRGIGAPK